VIGEKYFRFALSCYVGVLVVIVYFVPIRILMRNTMLLTGLLVLALSACAQPRVVSTFPTKLEQNDTKHPFAEKCEDAKYQLDKTVEAGQLSDLRGLKRNIELYCVWRRN
jgi:type IV pilus biogenesis protein CpaD/CtpE